MNNIKIRAWDGQTMWYQGREGFPFLYALLEHIYQGGHSIFHVEFMLWTGLKDSKGIEIYSGDIVKDLDTIRLIKWNDEEASYKMYRKDNSISFITFNADECPHMEVIGNIFENPELLEEK